jgi:hypothetical protein
MAFTPRGITDDYYNYLRSENGQAWHQQWLQRHGPLKGPHVTDPRSEENRKAFFYFWWNDFTLPDMKEAMIAEGITLDYKEYFSSVLPSKSLLTRVSDRCYASRLHKWGLPSNLQSRRAFRHDYEAHLDMINTIRPQSFPETTEHILRIHEDYFPLSFSQNCEVSNSLQSDDPPFNKHQTNHQMPYINPITFRQGYDTDAFHGFGTQFNSAKCRDPWEEHKIKVPVQYLYDDTNQNMNENVPIEDEIHHQISQGHGNSASVYHRNGFGTDSEQHTLNGQTRGHIPNAAINQNLPNSGIHSGLARHTSRRGMHGFTNQPQVCSYQPRRINIPSPESDRKTAFGSSAECDLFGNGAEYGFDSSAYDLDFNNASTQSGHHQRQQSVITQDAFLDSSQSMSLKDFLQPANLGPMATLANLQHDDVSTNSNPIFPLLKVIRDSQSTESIQQPNQSLPLQAIVQASVNSELLMQDWHEALISLPPYANSSLSKSQQNFQQHVELTDTNKAIDQIDVASKSAATPVHIWMGEDDVNAGLIAGTEVNRKNVAGSGHFL